MESAAAPALSFPVGFRFLPTENELLGYYLRGRIAYGPYCFGPHCLVKDRDLYGKTEPWVIWEEELRLLGINKEAEEEELPDLYFFTELKKKSKKKSKNGSNFDRLVGSGFWKGEDGGFEVREYRTNRVLGVRRRFRYEGGDPKQEGHWILMEFTLDPSLLPNSQQPNNLVVCKLRYNKKAASVPSKKIPSKKRKAAKHQENEEAVPSKKRLEKSVVTTLNPCSAKPQPHSESQGECSTVVVADQPFGIPHPCTASKMEHHDETTYFHAESQLQQYSTLVEDHHSGGFPLPCPATEEEYHDETYFHGESQVHHDETSYFHAESQLQHCTLVEEYHHSGGFPLPCPATKEEYHDETYLHGESQVHHDETSYFHAESQLQQFTLVEEYHHSGGFPLPCPATKEEYHDETTSAAAANTDLPIDETSAADDDLPNDDWWRELLGDEMFTDSNYLELDDLFFDDLSDTTFPHLPPTPPH